MTEEVKIEDIIEKISKETNGCPSLKEVKPFLVSKYKKTDPTVVEFLETEFVTDSIKWLDVKTRVWETEKEQNENKFSFIQGDIVSTSKVLRLGTAESNQDHDLWIVRAPSCDCVRAEYVRVSPLIEVKDKKGRPFELFRTALFFSTPNRFPIPKTILNDGDERVGFYADLTEPFFLHEDDKDDVVVHKSLKSNAWHLFNALNVNLESRANVEEEVKIRS